jgi:hypothetical protein
MKHDDPCLVMLELTKGGKKGEEDGQQAGISA